MSIDLHRLHIVTGPGELDECNALARGDSLMFGLSLYPNNRNPTYHLILYTEDFKILNHEQGKLLLTGGSDKAIEGFGLPFGTNISVVYSFKSRRGFAWGHRFDKIFDEDTCGSIANHLRHVFGLSPESPDLPYGFRSAWEAMNWHGMNFHEFAIIWVKQNFDTAMTWSHLMKKL